MVKHGNRRADLDVKAIDQPFGNGAVRGLYLHV
jgi:hypothetical protein